MRTRLKITILTLIVGSLMSCTRGEKITMKDKDTATGDEAVKGKMVSVHYSGWISENGAKGNKFDSSYDREKPFEFKLGSSSVIKGWNEGITGMKVGGRRLLVIPSSKAYGKKGYGSIPPDSDLIFEVELLSVK